jgi:hypothetical protein
MPGAVPLTVRARLLPIAQRVFWWGKPEEWIEDTLRFVAQVMAYGDWEDVRTTLNLLGKEVFLDVLNNPPPGVFDQKSWTFWHLYYHQPVPPMPIRKL